MQQNCSSFFKLVALLRLHFQDSGEAFTLRDRIRRSGMKTANPVGMCTIWDRYRLLRGESSTKPDNQIEPKRHSSPVETTQARFLSSIYCACFEPIPETDTGYRRPIPETDTGDRYRRPIPETDTGYRRPIPETDTGDRYRRPIPETDNRRPIPIYHSSAQMQAVLCTGKKNLQQL
jgi:hypothetical protein